MLILDDPSKIKKLDKSHMLQHVMDMPLHCQDARGDAFRNPLKIKVSAVKNVVISGVGGSAISGDALASYLGPTASFPIVVNRHYGLPAWVSRNTLVVCSSYSGNTEETLSVFKQALAKKSQIMVVSSSGTLLDQARRRKLPFCLMPTGLQPRATLGYSLITLLTVFEKLKMIPSCEKDFRETMELLSKLAQKYNVLNPMAKNEAKQLAKFFFEKLPVIYASQDYFESVAYRWKCQFNENAKQLAWMNVISEMNHNEVSGFTFEEVLTKKMAVVLLRSSRHDHPRVQKRFDILKRLVEAKTAGVKVIGMEGKSVLAQTLSTIYLGDFVTVYLACLKGLDPTPIDLIDSFKRQLGSLKK